MNYTKVIEELMDIEFSNTDLKEIKNKVCALRKKLQIESLQEKT